MKCPYCGYEQAEPPKCKKCFAAIEPKKQYNSAEKSAVKPKTNKKEEK